MSLLVVGSVALDSIFTPFGETADALGGSAVYFSVAGSILHPVQVVGVVGQDYPYASSSGWPRGASTGRGVERAEGRAFAGRANTPTTCRAARRWRPGSACSPTSSPGSRPRFGPPASSSSGNIDPELQLGVLEQVKRARAGGVRHHELLDPEQEGRAAPAAGAGRRAHGERRRGARAERRLEHPPGRPLDPGSRAQAGGHQAGRAWRAADRAEAHLLCAGLPAGECLRPDRRRRRLRRRVHGLSGPHRLGHRGQPAPGHGVRRRHGLVCRGAVRHPGLRPMSPWPMWKPGCAPFRI